MQYYLFVQFKQYVYEGSSRKWLCISSSQSFPSPNDQYAQMLPSNNTKMCREVISHIPLMYKANTDTGLVMDLVTMDNLAL